MCEESNEVTKYAVVTVKVKVNVDQNSWHNEEVERKIREAIMVGTKHFDGDVEFEYNMSITHI
jgi:hypothetical protein